MKILKQQIKDQKITKEDGEKFENIILELYKNRENLDIIYRMLDKLEELPELIRNEVIYKLKIAKNLIESHYPDYSFIRQKLLSLPENIMKVVTQEVKGIFFDKEKKQIQIPTSIILLFQDRELGSEFEKNTYELLGSKENLKEIYNNTNGMLDKLKKLPDALRDKVIDDLEIAKKLIELYHLNMFSLRQKLLSFPENIMKEVALKMNTNGNYAYDEKGNIIEIPTYITLLSYGPYDDKYVEIIDQASKLAEEATKLPLDKITDIDTLDPIKNLLKLLNKLPTELNEKLEKHDHNIRTINYLRKKKTEKIEKSQEEPISHSEKEIKNGLSYRNKILIAGGIAFLSILTIEGIMMTIAHVGENPVNFGLVKGLSNVMPQFSSVFENIGVQVASIVITAAIIGGIIALITSIAAQEKIV